VSLFSLVAVLHPVLAPFRERVTLSRRSWFPPPLVRYRSRWLRRCDRLRPIPALNSNSGLPTTNNLELTTPLALPITSTERSPSHDYNPFLDLEDLQFSDNGSDTHMDSDYLVDADFGSDAELQRANMRPTMATRAMTLLTPTLQTVNLIQVRGF
jgi:hypothetical protein